MEDYDKEHVNDLWEDMDKLNKLYDELGCLYYDWLRFVVTSRAKSKRIPRI